METSQPCESLYVVEKIIGKKFQGKKVLYKVKWKDYSENECTWEKVSHLRYVPDLIEEYEKTLSADTSKSSLGTSSQTSQDEAVSIIEPASNDPVSIHESIKEVNQEEEREKLQEQPDNEGVKPTQDKHDKSESKLGHKNSKEKSCSSNRSSRLTGSSQKIVKRARNATKNKARLMRKEEDLKRERLLKKDMKRLKKMSKENSRISLINRDSNDSEETAIDKADRQKTGSNALKTRSVIKSEEDDGYETAEIKIRLIVADDDSDIRDYVVEYPCGTSKIFNTCEIFYSHPVEFVGYLEKKAAKHKK